MRKKIASSVLAASLALTTVPAIAPAPATAQTAQGEAQLPDTAVGRGIENAFDPKVASSMKEDSFKGFLEMAFRPYSLLFKGENTEQRVQGATQLVINYAIIAAVVTVLGQAVQIVMSNLPR